MEIIQVPAATCAQPQISAGQISFVNYRDQGGPFRNRVLFDRFAFSFVQNGQKQIYRANKNTILSAGQGMLIPEGNSIIAEHSDNTAPYHSVIIFFPGQLGRNFISRNFSQLTAPGKNDAPFVHFKMDSYLEVFVRHIREMVENKTPVSEALALHKLEELLLVMAERHPAELQSMFGAANTPSLKKLVENNLMNKLSLDELAFLANRSLASFKRDFEKCYGLPPQRYIRERKLELALHELRNGKNPGDIYLDYGYENLSNFNTAFKRRYGQPPVTFLHQLTN
jgi:AraC-like DNA-binding protein